MIVVTISWSFCAEVMDAVIAKKYVCRTVNYNAHVFFFSKCRHDVLYWPPRNTIRVHNRSVYIYTLNINACTYTRSVHGNSMRIVLAILISAHYLPFINDRITSVGRITTTSTVRWPSANGSPKQWFRNWPTRVKWFYTVHTTSNGCDWCSFRPRSLQTCVRLIDAFAIGTVVFDRIRLPKLSRTRSPFDYSS